MSFTYATFYPNDQLRLEAIELEKSSSDPAAFEALAVKFDAAGRPAAAGRMRARAQALREESRIAVSWPVSVEERG